MKEIEENYRRVKENIARAAERVGRDPSTVRLLAATKTVPPEEILYCRELGLDLIGENRVTELTDKYPTLGVKIEQHFIGHLQTNKVKSVVGRVSVIESVDSEHLAAEIDRRSRLSGVQTDILLEVNSGREASKSGFYPEQLGEALGKISAFSALRVRGLMTMAPKTEEIEGCRKYFQETYKVFIDFFPKNTHNIIEPILSMGMSDSYAIAVEEGATEVRVGQAIFARRVYL